MSDATIGSSVGQVKDVPKSVGMVDEAEVEESSTELNKLSQARPS